MKCCYSVNEDILLLPNSITSAKRYRIILSIKEEGTIPSYIFDGMTSDLDGNLYVATFGGSKIIKVDPR